MSEENTADNQAKSSRDEKGRFLKGNETGWKPGQSGNPAGRPKTITLSEAYRNALAQPMPKDKKGRTIAEVIAEKVCLEAAFTGNVQAAREIADRTEGKPKQAVDLNANVFDWRELAKQYGINEHEVLIEAQRIIGDALAAGDAESDR